MMSSVSSVGVILMVLISVAFFSLFERKVMGSVQYRKGPNKVSMVGFLQPFSDAMKLLTKVDSSPSLSAKVVYGLSPVLVMLLPLFIWSTLPIDFGFFSSEMGMIIILVYFSMSVYGIIFTGWSSNSRYATLGCVRAIGQSISYEIGLSFVFILLMVICSSFSVMGVVSSQGGVWNVIPLFPVAVVGLICLLAESSRTPFDLPESESELVSGFNVEYGGGKYTVIFLGENLALLWASEVFSFSFLGGSLFPVLLFMMVWIRSSFPRVRYDVMMKMFWLSILPLSIVVCGALPLMTL